MKIEVNGRPLEVKDGLTILEALKEHGISIPTLCYLENMTPTGACRICVVEVEGMGSLIPACAFPAGEGMKIQTHSPRVRAARKTIVELLLANHPEDCLYCERNLNCQLQDLAHEMGVRHKRYRGERKEYKLDTSSPSLERDPSKCILCGKCVRVCEEVQGVGAIDFVNRGFKTHVEPAFNRGLNVSPCIYCGQCIMVCPTGALREKSSLKEVWEAINDKTKTVIFQMAPAISVSIGEEFGYEPGTELSGKLVSACKRMGVDMVFDTSVAADLTVIEEANELLYRIQNAGKLPMITSCSPGWVKYVEHFHPEFIDNLSSCRSPQEMLGSLLKTYYAEKEGKNPEDVFVVSVMPCTAKKFEVKRPEFYKGNVPDVDVVLTTREMARMIKISGLDFQAMPDQRYDDYFNLTSSAGKIFGSTGGVMEAALRTAYCTLTGKDLQTIEFEPVRGLNGVKEAVVDINGLKLSIVVASGLTNADIILKRIKENPERYQFIEIMACPGGCIAGGGQPKPQDKEIIAKRQQALYSIDKNAQLRLAHQNPVIKKIYDDYLGKPLGHKSHDLLHTHYRERDKF
ncbi:MAG: [FeFe] hydrogenase, group A [Firmicutes bacterium]|nr:[FeFe] hydrogenase, group A [Bacillota bacterium]